MSEISLPGPPAPTYDQGWETGYARGVQAERARVLRLIADAKDPLELLRAVEDGPAMPNYPWERKEQGT